jgi:transcriptional regulator with XRE-family HTH domain
MLPKMRDIEAIRRDVREKMAKDGISARQVMRDTGISHVTINKFLKGQADTHDQTVIKLCLYLSLDWYEHQSPETTP